MFSGGGGFTTLIKLNARDSRLVAVVTTALGPRKLMKLPTEESAPPGS